MILLGLVPIRLDSVLTQIGVSEAEQLLCSSGVNIGQIVVLVLVAVSVYFIGKSFIRILNREIRGGLYSFIAGIVPLFIPTLLALIGVDTGCLLPG